MSPFKRRRMFMKSGFAAWDDDRKSDQERGIPEPPIEEPYEPDKGIVALPSIDPLIQRKPGLFNCMVDRRSRRSFTPEPLSLNELGFLLWATQGIQRVIPAYHQTGNASLRTVPSAGARHAFETYLGVTNVDGLEPGIHRYLALSHDIAFMKSVNGMRQKLIDIALEQSFVGDAPVVLFWVCVPYRGEWRYHHEAHKLMLLDAGHICQNLYLAAETLQCGTCAVAAYDQEAADDLLGLDGENSFVVYFAPVGRRQEHLIAGD